VRITPLDSSCAVFFEILVYNKHEARLIERFFINIFFIRTLAASVLPEMTYYFTRETKGFTEPCWERLLRCDIQSGRTHDIGDPWDILLIQTSTRQNIIEFFSGLFRTVFFFFFDLAKIEFGAPSDRTALFRLISFF
jgi:hypothetical protein